MGPHLQRGDHADHAGSLVPKIKGTDRSAATGITVDESNQGKDDFLTRPKVSFMLRVTDSAARL